MIKVTETFFPEICDANNKQFILQKNSYKYLILCAKTLKVTDSRLFEFSTFSFTIIHMTTGWDLYKTISWMMITVTILGVFYIIICTLYRFGTDIFFGIATTKEKI